ncbi:MAG: AGE family epimerase/isomerase [Pseudomonadota bacterium]
MNKDLGPSDPTDLWVHSDTHRDWLTSQSKSLLSFFDASRQDSPGFALLDHDGTPLDSDVQALHTTTRLIHSYALGSLQDHPGADQMVEHGMAYLNGHHKDQVHGGYIWSLQGDAILDDKKLAYGHVFVLLAASSAKLVGHPDADALIDDISDVLNRQFWDEDAGLFREEWHRDWTSFSDYRGMNANMHGVEALLAAYEATGRTVYLQRAGRILDFFTNHMAPANQWRLPEHYHIDWSVDQSYAGNHMFRPAGTTPGHSFELGRLLLQYWDLMGRPDTGAPHNARNLITQAMRDAWLPDGGLAYTLHFDGTVADASRFWWPVTEAINAFAALILLEKNPEDEARYRQLWQFADRVFIDHRHGGWFPAIDDDGAPTSSIFAGKPDIYHALQACLFPLSGRVSEIVKGWR